MVLNKEIIINNMKIDLPRDIIYNANILQKLYEEKKIQYSLSTIKKYFGTVYNLLDILDLKYKKQKISKKEILYDLKKLPRNIIYNSIILEKKHREGLICALQVIRKNFGTLENALILSGLKFNLLKKRIEQKNMSLEKFI